MDFRLKEPLYLNVPFDDKDKAKELDAFFDRKVKRWYITADLDALKYRKWWGFLDCPYADKEKAKAKGARFDRNLKKWYVPSSEDFDDFSEWWPDQLRQFIFGDRFAIASLVCKSGQASVYRAYNLKTYEKVAIKFFAIDDDQPKMKEAFLREMKAYKTLSKHPNILDVVESGQHGPTKRMFIAYPYCDWDLAQFLSSTKEEQVDLFINAIMLTFEDLDEENIEEIRQEALKELEQDEGGIVDSWEVLSPVLDALVYAYARGVIHRDIKPGNILLRTDFDPDTEEIDFVCYLADFGTSKLKDLEMNFGTTLVDWQSSPWGPERSETEKIFQETWDVHGWAMCFMAESVDELFEDYDAAERALNSSFKDLAPADLHSLIARCIHRDPSERPVNVKVLHEEINAIMADIISDRS